MAPQDINSYDVGDRKFEASAIDLFCGCGGLTYGLKMAGFSVLGAIESDPIGVRTYRLNHPEISTLEADIRTVDSLNWMRLLKLKAGELDLLAGCPPCQGFSQMRTRNGTRRIRDSRNVLLFEMARFASTFRPKVLMVENVPALENKRLFREFRAQLKRLGYAVKVVVADAQDYGVPQRRRRLILIASIDVEVEFPIAQKTRISVREAIGWLPRAGESGDRLHDFGEWRTPRLRDLMAKIPPDGGGRLSLPPHEQLPCHTRSDGYKDSYGRMCWARPAPTITTGCYNPSKGRYLHPEENRCITMREAALLQTFPASFTVDAGVSKTHVARMLGNALPPEFVRRHAREVYLALRGEASISVA